MEKWEGKAQELIYRFQPKDEAIHELAVNVLLGDDTGEFILSQGNYAYKVSGGRWGGALYYKTRGREEGVLIANWCFYGIYCAVRYRKAQWLRPMYKIMFANMGYPFVSFSLFTLEIRNKAGETLSGRLLRLSPSNALSEVLIEKFGFTPEKVEKVKEELKIDL